MNLLPCGAFRPFFLVRNLIEKQAIPARKPKSSVVPLPIMAGIAFRWRARRWTTTIFRYGSIRFFGFNFSVRLHASLDFGSGLVISSFGE